VRTLAGILLLIIGVIFPMAMLFQMNSVLSRKPAPRPSRVGMLLALNGVLPVALIISGLMLLSDRFSAAPALRAAMIATWVASLALLIILVIGKGAGRRKGGGDGG
jgi:hypothetical protein